MQTTTLQGDTAHVIAYQLARDISNKQDTPIPNAEYRAWLLDLYAECLAAASGARVRGRGLTKAKSDALAKSLGVDS